MKNIDTFTQLEIVFLEVQLNFAIDTNEHLHSGLWKGVLCK